MRIEKCGFCSHNVYPGKGTTFVRNDAKIFRFCVKKCRLAFMKKKNPAKTKWTKASRIIRGKELCPQIAQVFEKRRITMQKYDAETLKNTLESLPKVLSMIQKKKDHHIMKRLAVGTEDRKERDLYYVNNRQHLIRAPHANIEDEEMECEDDNMESQEEIEELDLKEIVSLREQAPEQKVRAKSNVKITEMA